MLGIWPLGWGMGVRGFKARLALIAVVIPIILVYIGIGEFWWCVRTMIGPTEVDYAKVTEDGLASYGFVRITGIELGLEKSVAIVHRNTQTHETGGWEGVYIPVGPAADVQPAGRNHVLLFLPEAREPQDVAALVDAEEVVGFVVGEFARINPGHQKFVRTLAGADQRYCWVLRQRHPSWLKAAGCVLGSLVIPGLFVAWKIKNPGVD